MRALSGTLYLGRFIWDVVPGTPSSAVRRQLRVAAHRRASCQSATLSYGV